MEKKSTSGWVSIARSGKVTAYVRDTNMSKNIFEPDIATFILFEDLSNLAVLLPKVSLSLSYREIGQASIQMGGATKGKIVGGRLYISCEDYGLVTSIVQANGREAMRVSTDATSSQHSLKISLYNDGSYQVQSE